MSHPTSTLHESVTPSHELPPQAAIPGTARHEPVDESESGANAVNSVQHAIRAAVATDGLEAASPTVERFASYEQAELLPDLDTFRAKLTNADQYLVDVFDNAFTTLEAELADRYAWYEKLVAGDWGHSIDAIATRAADLRHADSRLEVLTVTTSPGSDRHPDGAARLPADAFDTPIGQFGLEPPHTFLGIYNAEKASRYPFIPWYGTVVCTCPFKQQNPHMPCCKHELFAASINHQQSRSLPHPYLQLVSPLGRRFYADLYE
jgi:hypothetical protein